MNVARVVSLHRVRDIPTGYINPFQVFKHGEFSTRPQATDTHAAIRLVHRPTTWIRIPVALYHGRVHIPAHSHPQLSYWASTQSWREM